MSGAAFRAEPNALGRAYEDADNYMRRDTLRPLNFVTYPPKKLSVYSDESFRANRVKSLGTPRERRR